MHSPVAEQDINIGWEAYLNGDRETAYNVWRPLADQGHADAQYHLRLLWYMEWGMAVNHWRISEQWGALNS
jgi:hypothetical protein